MSAFSRALLEFFPHISHEQTKCLEMKYARSSNPQQFELKMFQEELA